MKKRLADEEEMKAFAQTFVQELLEKKSAQATVVGLTGDLGSGKTRFVTYALEALGISEEVGSPTFVLIREYPLKECLYTRVYHLDLYRLQDQREIFKRGLTDILQNPTALVFIEWADRIKDELPEATHWISFEHTEDPLSRDVTVW